MFSIRRSEEIGASFAGFDRILIYSLFRTAVVFAPVRCVSEIYRAVFYRTDGDSVRTRSWRRGRTVPKAVLSHARHPVDCVFVEERVAFSGDGRAQR